MRVRPTAAALFLFFCCGHGNIFSSNFGLEVKLICNGPAVLDTPITFTVTVYDPSGDVPEGNFSFVFRDNTYSGHRKKTEPSKSLTYSYILTYPSDKNVARHYTMYVDAFKIIFGFAYRVGSARVGYNITEGLIGSLMVHQKSRTCSDDVCDVSTTEPVGFGLSLHDPSSYLRDNAKFMYFWMPDSTNYGPSREAQFSWNFTREGSHSVQAAVVAQIGANGTSAAVTKYGAFSIQLEAEDPVSSVHVAGQTWLKHGDLLNLNVSCNGHQPWSYCVNVLPGSYNVTGNETCKEMTTTNDCNFFILRYFQKGSSYTISVIIENDVSKKVQGIPINIYYVSKKQQLSVIIIPLTCTVFAVIIVIFGVAYYIQSRRRFSVEVADFDFGGSEDIEYKTFYEHLQESVSSAFRRGRRSDMEPLCDDNIHSSIETA